MTLFKLTAQSKQLQDRLAETNCTFANLGSFLNIDQYQMECKAANLFTTGKLFLKDLLNLSSMEVSINALKPNEKASFNHYHVNNEELYLVLKGSGKLSVDNKEYLLQEGSVAAVLPKGIRRVDAKEGGLIFICIQAKQDSLTAYTLDDGKIC
ncbi:MAG: cupin domain-containing protein [Succinivibrio sp.]|nr:cupin domain-containing protein [Succinivibrio sp.]